MTHAMNAKIFRDAQHLALEAGLLGARAGEWATREGHALFVSAQKWLEAAARAAAKAEAAEHKHGLGAEAPAAPPQQSVAEDHLVCLEDGKHFKTLKRHLREAHGLTPEAYREKWGLAADYPMTAPGNAAKRAAKMRTSKKAAGPGLRTVKAAA